MSKTMWALCRVSTADQNLDRQEKAARRWAAHHDDITDVSVVTAKTSGAAKKRPDIDRILAEARPGDVFWCAELSRIGRSLTYTLNVLHTLHEKGVRIVVADGNIDFGSPMGRAFAAIVAAFAELERDILRERTLDGLDAARRRGVHIGRRADRWDEEADEKLSSLIQDGWSLNRIVREGGISVWRPERDQKTEKWTDRAISPGRTKVQERIKELGLR